MKIGDVILDPYGELVELLDIYPDKELLRVAYKDPRGYFTIHKCHYMHDCRSIPPVFGKEIKLEPGENWVPFKGESDE